jgi:hypothetical protein
MRFSVHTGIYLIRQAGVFLYPYWEGAIHGMIDTIWNVGSATGIEAMDEGARYAMARLT